MNSNEIREMSKLLEDYWPDQAVEWMTRDGYRTLFSDIIRPRGQATVQEALRRLARSKNRAPSLDDIDAKIDEVAGEEREREARDRVDLPTPDQVAGHSLPERQEGDKLITRESLGMIRGLLNGSLSREAVSSRCARLSEDHPQLKQYWIKYAATVYPEMFKGAIADGHCPECPECGEAEMIFYDSEGFICGSCKKRYEASRGATRVREA